MPLRGLERKKSPEMGICLSLIIDMIAAGVNSLK